MGCDYILVGLAGNRCPECGRAFDPNDPKTVRTGRILSKWAEHWLTPFGKPTQIFACVASAIALIAASVPGSMSMLIVAAFVLWFCLAVAWCVRILLALLYAYYHRHPAYRGREIYLRWARIPILGVVTVLLVFGNVPLYVTFLISKPAMDDFAHKMLTQSPASSAVSETRLGVFPVHRIERHGNGIRFLVRGAGCFDCAGFAYSTNGPPPRRGANYYTHLWGPWYEWIED